MVEDLVKAADLPFSYFSVIFCCEPCAKQVFVLLIAFLFLFVVVIFLFFVAVVNTA